MDVVGKSFEFFISLFTRVDLPLQLWGCRREERSVLLLGREGSGYILGKYDFSLLTLTLNKDNIQVQIET